MTVSYRNAQTAPCSQQRDLSISLLFALVAAIALPSAACKSSGSGTNAEANGPCDAAKLEAGATALAAAERSIRPSLAGVALDEACTNAPAGLKQVFSAENIGPDQRALLIASGVSKEAVLLVRGCAGGPQVLATMASVPPEDRSEVVYDGCRLDPNNRIASRAEFLAAPSDALMAFMLTHAYMGEQAESGAGRTLLRGLLGL